MDPSAVLVPIRQAVEEPVLVEPNEIPLNHTDLGNKVKVADNATFHKSRGPSPYFADFSNPDSLLYLLRDGSSR